MHAELDYLVEDMPKQRTIDTAKRTSLCAAERSQADLLLSVGRCAEETL